MVGAHHPVGVEAAHAVVAHERIHQRLLEGVAHVQGAGDVGRRQLDAVGGPGILRARLEVAGRFPALVPALLDRGRSEALVDHCGSDLSAVITEAATASRTMRRTLTASSARTASSALPSVVSSARVRFSLTTRSSSGP